VQDNRTRRIAVTEQDKYAEKIAKLLRKAESTDSPEEAEQLVTKAQELMTAYAIDEMMIARVKGEQGKTSEDIIAEDIEYNGVFQSTLMDLGYVVVRMNDCRGIFSQHDAGSRTSVDGKRSPSAHVLHVIGFESDVRRVKMLDSSLQIQCARAMNNWWNEEGTPWASKSVAFKARRQFIMGFAAGLSERLSRAKDEGQKEAARREAARSNTTEETATQSVALELRSRKDRVDDWVDKQYGKLRSFSRRYSSGGSGAMNAGVAAGRNADLGSPAVGGRRGALGR
jgi:hypothetical protein